MTKSQDKFRLSEIDNDDYRRKKNKTLDRGRKREIQNVNDEEMIKEIIKEKYIYKDGEEENERIAKELDIERIDREIK